MLEITKEYIENFLTEKGESNFEILEISLIGSKYFLNEEDRPTTDFDILVVGNNFINDTINYHTNIDTKKYDIAVINYNHLLNLIQFPRNNNLFALWAIHYTIAKE